MRLGEDQAVSRTLRATLNTGSIKRYILLRFIYSGQEICLILKQERQLSYKLLSVYDFCAAAAR